MRREAKNESATNQTIRHTMNVASWRRAGGTVSAERSKVVGKVG